MSTKKCFPVGYRYNIQPIHGNPNKTRKVLLGQEDIKNNRQIIYESLLKGKEETLVIV